MKIDERYIIWFILNLYEGWYGNDPDDAGGETFRGISRKAHPEWHGWAMIDAIKEKRDFGELVKKSRTLKEYVIAFYEENFWGKMNLYTVPIEVATEVFEQSINFGKNRATKHLQISCNAVGYGVANSLAEDGEIGIKTAAAVIQICNAGRDVKLLRALNSLQGCRYIELMRKNPKYRKFVGWFNRVDYSLYQKIKREKEI